MAKTKSDTLQGTLALLVLKSLERCPMHGWGITLHIQRISDEVLRVEEGSLYPALHRKEASPRTLTAMVAEQKLNRRNWTITCHGNDGMWKAWKAKKPAFHPSQTPWKSLRDSHIATATATTIMYLKTGKACRKPAIGATLTARGL